jgi:steroid delta-isomerase-like uncharacterized protein
MEAEMSASAGSSAGHPDWARATEDGWNAHDGAAVVAQMTDDVIYVDLGSGERYEGRAAVSDFIDRAEREFSTDYHFEWGQFIADEESFAVEWVMSGVNDRANERFPATGKQFEIRGASVGRLRNGKIAENKSYWNLADYLVQVGLMAAPEAAAPAAG